MSEQKLSERLKKSAEKLFEKHLKTPYVSQLLMTGRGFDEPKNIAIRLFKDVEDIIIVWKEIFEVGINKTDDQKEREILEQCILGIPVMHEQWKEKFIMNFGKVNENYLSEPMTQDFWSYKQHMVKEASLGSMLDLLVVILPSVLVTSLVNNHIAKNPEFKPNLYFEVLSFKEFEVDKFVNTLESLIDLRGEFVSEEEEKQLCEIFKRSVIYETLIIDFNMN